ncbi:Holliday junction resolvase RuvX [bacterium]|nr:MAG: Holliday junction resolvase RuvX [bacterium]
MNPGRILAIDYGERRIGLALSDPMRIIASGLTTIQVQNENAAIQKIKKLVNEHEVIQIVMGNPLDKNGSEGTKAQKVRIFAEKLRQQIPLDIVFWDERMSSVTALKMLVEAESKKKRRTKEKIDELAAVVILRHYLDASF